MADIRLQIAITANPRKVYSAITTQEGITNWWNKDTIAKPEVGFVNIFKSGGKTHTELKVIELIPGKKAGYECIKGIEEWLGSQILFFLEEKNGVTILDFLNTGLNEKKSLTINESDWMFYLESLKSFCEGGRGTPYE